MHAHQAADLASLLRHQQTAALATLHRGRPAVSMVPYALLPAGEGFVLHVSTLATHTADMRATPAVALLVVAPAGSAPSPRELARASVQGEAHALEPGTPDHATAKAAYLARFPQSEDTFGFSDFALFQVTVSSVRFVGGLGNATSALAARYRQIMAAAGA